MNNKHAKKFHDLVPVLEAEGRKPVKPIRNVGMQTNPWLDDDELREALAMNFEYAPIIEDWAKTPIFQMLRRGQKEP